MCIIHNAFRSIKKFMKIFGNGPALCLICHNSTELCRKMGMIKGAPNCRPNHTLMRRGLFQVFQFIETVHADKLVLFLNHVLGSLAESASWFIFLKNYIATVDFQFHGIPDFNAELSSELHRKHNTSKFIQFPHNTRRFHSDLLINVR